MAIVKPLSYPPKSSLPLKISACTGAATVPSASKVLTRAGNTKPLGVQCGLKKQGLGSTLRATNRRCLKPQLQKYINIDTTTLWKSPVIAEIFTAALNHKFP